MIGTHICAFFSCADIPTFSFPIAAEYVKVYERMLKLVPDFPDTMERFKADPTGLNLFINHVRVAHSFICSHS